jgi:hypothetical protein
MTQEDVGVMLNVMAGALQLDLMKVYALFDPRVSHSLLNYK